MITAVKLYDWYTGNIAITLTDGLRFISVVSGYKTHKLQLYSVDYNLCSE